MAEPRATTSCGLLDVYQTSGPAEGQFSKESRWQLEERVRLGLGILATIRAGIRDWKDQVFSGAREFLEADDSDFRSQLDAWLKTSRGVLEQIVAFEKAIGFNTISGSQDLRPEIGLVEDDLTRWVSPALSQAIGLREDALSREQSDQLRTAIETGTANPVFQPRRLPTGN